MHRPAPALPVLVLLLALPACAVVQRNDVPDGTLSAGEIRALFTDRTVKSVTFSNGRVSETYYMASGELRQSREGKLRLGTWRVPSRGRLCQQVGEAEENCRAIVRIGDTYLKYKIRKSGDHRPTVRYISFTPGNPLGL